jgi:WD40 repeat protein
MTRMKGVFFFVAALGFILCASAARAEDARTPTGHEAAAPVIRRLVHNAVVTALTWSPDSRFLATASDYNKTITVWDAQRGKIIRELRRDLAIGESLAFSDGGKHLLTSVATGDAQEENTAISVWDVGIGAIVGHILGPYPDRPVVYNAARHFALSDDQHYLAVIGLANPDEPVGLYDFRDKQKIGALRCERDIPITLAFSPDGSRLAVGTIGGKIIQFQLATQTAQTRIDAFGGSAVGVAALAYSPDGRFIAAGPTSAFAVSGKGTPMFPANPIRIWRADAGNAAYSLVSDVGAVESISWSPDGRFIALAGENGDIYLWEPARASRPIVVAAFHEPATSVAFSPDGKLLAAAGADLVVLISNSSFLSTTP